MYPVGFLCVPVELTQEFSLKESLTMALLAMASPILVTSSWWLSIKIALLESKLLRFSFRQTLFLTTNSLLFQRLVGLLHHHSRDKLLRYSRNGAVCFSTEPLKT